MARSLQVPRLEHPPIVLRGLLRSWVTIDGRRRDMFVYAHVNR